ncbi:MAG: Fe-S cluster assembly sulfur transfer protein SufU [Patescibacteria group bacterium]
MDIYRELILDHYKHPRNFGHLDNPDVVAQEGNVTCGDRIVIEIKVKSQKSKVKSIEDIRFSGEGCAISQASASLLTEKVKGMNFSQVLKLKTSDILTMLGTTLTPTRVKCATLALEVLQKAVGNVL